MIWHSLIKTKQSLIKSKQSLIKTKEDSLLKSTESKLNPKINFAIVLVLDTHQSLNRRMPGSYVD